MIITLRFYDYYICGQDKQEIITKLLQYYCSIITLLQNVIKIITKRRLLAYKCCSGDIFNIGNGRACTNI